MNAIKKELFLKRAMEEECGEGEYRSGNDDKTEEGRFAKNYRSLDIKTESLPQYTKQKVVYTTQKPAFVVAWLQDHLEALLK
jgi:hypothetical protein